MRGAYDREMPVVNRGNFCDVETLGYSDEGCICAPQWKVAVRRDQLAHPAHVFRRHVYELSVGSLSQVL